jgi:hypothetical protein
MTRRSFGSALCAALALPLLVLASMVVSAGPAGAHEGDAIIEVDQEHPGATSTHYFVQVTWEDDGHPVVDGTVTATAVSPDGVEQTPVTLNMYDADQGLYEATVEMPEEGTWTVRFTSVDPPGSIEHTQEVAAAAPATPETERTPDEAVDDDATVSDDDATTAEEDAVEIDAAAASDDDSGPSILVLVLVFLLLATAVAGIFWLMTRRQSADDPGEAADDEASDEQEETAVTADTGSGAGAGDTGGGDSSTA